MNSRVSLACALVAGCTFGGSDEDPTNGYSADISLDGGGSINAADSSVMQGMDGSLVADTGTRDASAGDAGKGDGGSAGAGGSMCKPAQAVAVCDPVANTGCDFLLQCDIDSDAKTQAGRCVFWTLSLASCSANALTETCDPKNTCVKGQCKALCYCDKDCPSGTKCTGTVPGPAGAVMFCQ